MTEGYKVRPFSQPVKRYCQTMDLRDNPELIAKYKEAHDSDHAWKEVLDGIREVGILEMEISLIGNHLTMIVDTPADFNGQESMDRLAKLPRQAEWEAFVSRFQNCSPDVRSDEKWKPMERIFRLYD